MVEIKKIIEQLSPLERKIIPYLSLPITEIKEKTNLDDTSLLRALKFLENKNLVRIKIEKKKIIDLGTNGINYRKTRLPERALLTFIEQHNYIPILDAKKQSKLSENEFTVSLGILKYKGFIELKSGKLAINAPREMLMQKTREEQLLEILPLDESQLTEEQRHTFMLLRKRKDIVEIKERSITGFVLTDLGKQISGKHLALQLIEEVTPEIIKNWKRGKKFRKYDIHSEVPKLYGSKQHFINAAIEEGKRIWLDLGFEEMQGTMTQISFWNFDALFTAQDHPVRELHDTFYIKDVKGKLPDKQLVKKVKRAHERGVAGSEGWRYRWSDDDARRVLLRTHTTCLSAQTIAKLKKSDLPKKFFTIGKNFRNETVDWSHGFEFNQSEGIVVDPHVNFKHLLGYLQEFVKKLGFEKIRMQPAYFPYTEPSIEGAVWVEEKKEWVEILAAGIFRPEVTEPLLGEPIPVLAWGPGFDRLMMLVHGLSDLRKIYENDLADLRKQKVAVK